MKYVRTKEGTILEFDYTREVIIDGIKHIVFTKINKCDGDEYYVPENYIIKQTDTIEELCDCFVKIKRKGNCKPYILKFDYKDLPTLKEQAIKYKDSPVYGAIHIEDKGLIYVTKLNEKGKFELLKEE